MVGIKWKLKLIYSFVLNLIPVARVLSVRLYLEITFFSPFFHELMIKLRQQSFKPITEGCCKVSDSPLTLFFWLLSSSAVLSCSPPTIVRTDQNCVSGQNQARTLGSQWGSRGSFLCPFSSALFSSVNTHVHTQRQTNTPLQMVITAAKG